MGARGPKSYAQLSTSSRNEPSPDDHRINPVALAEAHGVSVGSILRSLRAARKRGEAFTCPGDDGEEVWYWHP
jgi:hypothetical protein